MAGTSTEDSGVGKPYEEVSIGQQKQLFQSGEALAEWRSLEQVESGSPSTSPSYWDCDDYDNDRGPKPADLYGKHTWKIDNFSQTNKRELRSIAFEVGGYKWYILIYPQGCDVSNHLSLFLCVAEHDKLLPGWSHFAQFTIAVVNKDPNKSKYSDTLHKFCKKEHDWGWKKFMELSKVMDGFIEDEALIIKAQVQVIRERVDRPFRCLECQYRRELVRVYLTNVEQICRRFMEERKGKLRTLIEDKARWSSFRAFWVEEGHSSRLQMSSEKKDSILKVAVKLFFIEKEVTSTLVMESLYSGLKALEGQNKGNKSKEKCLEAEELPEPIVRVEKDKFSLVDDVLLLLERAAVEPLPPKDDKKGPQNRTKDGSAGEEFNKDSMEHDERRLTELGRRTIEIFALAHIFSKIDTAYKEAVSLKKQEELIREEEASCLAVLEQKARRGQADKEKKSKKKQGKQKRNNRKGKDKGQYERIIITVQDKIEEESPAERNELTSDPETVLEKSEAAEYASDVSDSVDCASEIIQPEYEGRELSPVNWDTDTSDAHHPIESGSEISGISGVQNGKERSSSVVDDASSTCSSDSVPSVVSIANKGKSPYNKNKKSPSRGTVHQTRLISESADWVNEEPSLPVLDPTRSNDASHSSNTVGSHSLDSVLPLQDKAANGVDQKVEKKILLPVLQKEETGSNRGKVIPSIAEPKIRVRRPSDIPNQAAGNSSVPASKSAESPAKSKPVDPSQAREKTAQIRSEKLDKSSTPYTPLMSRPLSAPLAPGPRPAAPIARSVSAAGRLGPEPTTTYVNRSYVPQSYRNAIIGGPGPLPLPGYSQNQTGSCMVNASSHSYSYSHASSLFTPGLAERTNHNHESPQSGPAWDNNVQQSRPYDEFPHLDIINELLDDDLNSGCHGFGNGLNRYYSFPGEPVGPGPSCRFDRARSYQGGIEQGGYGVGSGRRYEVRDGGMNRDMIRPPHIGNGMLPNQWEMSGSDAVSYLSLRSLGSDGGYPYHIPEYRPSNGR